GQTGDSAGGPVIDSGGGTSGDAGGGVTGTQAVFGASGGGGSAGAAAFDRALWGPLGMPSGELARDAMNMANNLAADSTGGGTGTGAGGGTTTGGPMAHLAFEHKVLESFDAATTAMIPGPTPATPTVLATPFFNA